MHQVERRCIACKQCFNQTNLLRVAKIKDEFVLDTNHKLDGRGAYVCKQKKCLDIVIKKKLLNKAFKNAVDENIYLQLGEYEQN